MATAVSPVGAIETQVQTLEVRVKTLNIQTVEQYQVAGELCRTIAALRKEIDATFDPIISKAYAAHREACAQKKKFSAPLEEHQRAVDQKILGYDREQERIRREEEEQLREETRKQQEEQALREASELEAQGDSELAEIVVNEAISNCLPVVVVPSRVPKLEGVAKRSVWKFKITNAALIPREYMEPDEMKIGGVVRALKGSTKIPGVQVYEEQVAIHR